MENSVIKFKVNSGYQVIRRSKEVDLQTVYEVLESKKQNKYAEAIMSEDHAELVWYVARCPYCGKETSLYQNKGTDVHKHFFSDELVVMTGIQLSFLEHPENVICISEHKEKDGLYLCEKCCQFSRRSDEKSEITITRDGNLLNVFSEIGNLKNLFRLKWIDKVDLNSSFPLYEKICFDFDKGETTVSLVNEEDNIISSEEVTSDIIHKNQSSLIEMISKNYSLKRKLLREFSRYVGYDSGMSYIECNFAKFLMMTQFYGFDKSFYNAIPYEGATYRVESSFEEVANQLENPRSAMELLKNSSLPYVKSVKRIFTGNQGLFFYIKECEKIYDVLKDVNLLCKVLESKIIYTIFTDLHNYDNYILFYRDICKKVGNIDFCTMLTLHYDKFRNCAINYGSMSEYMRKKYIDEFDKKKNFKRGCAGCNVDYVVPMKKLNENIKDCVINDIAFKKLETKSDYITAGEKMDNCLDSWECHDNPVVVMLKRGEYVGAVEIGNGFVYDALGKYNEYIRKDDELFCAIKKWCEKYNVKWHRLKKST